MPTLPGGVRVERVDPNGAELVPWLHAVRYVFKEAMHVPDSVLDHRRRAFADHELTAVRDGGRVVATFRTWPTALAVPATPADGRCPSVPVSAISSVTVAPTHRRKGLLTHLMSEHLRAAKEAGAAAAVLIASEATIYGRYGFGVGTRHASWTVDVDRARAAGGAGAVDGIVEVVDTAQLRAIAPAIERLGRRAGTIDRDDAWWDARLGLDRPDEHDGRVRCVVMRGDDGEAVGYVRHRVHESWQGRRNETRNEILDLQGRDARAGAALWAYVVGLDLVATVQADERALDEPLPWLLADARAAERSGPMDALWVRPLDAAALLSGRSYTPGLSGAVVLEVRDAWGLAAGRFLLEVADGRGRCEPTGRPTDVALDIDVLGALALGDHGARGADLAGRAVDVRPGAFALLRCLLATPEAPWTAHFF